MTAPTDEDLISVAEVARIMGCSKRKVHHMIDAGKLTPLSKLASPTGAYIFRRGDVQPADLARSA